MKLAVVDYGMGNLKSVAHALEKAAPGQTVTVTGDPAALLAADRIVFPGVGAMPDCMRELTDSGLKTALLEAARTRPFLGICLGMQALFDFSEEGNVAGLGLLPGRVTRFTGQAFAGPEKLKVPHMGWNTVTPTAPHPLWEGIAPGSRFYFVHSYFVNPGERALTAATTPYPDPFTCAIARDNIFAVQFHPEKSQSAGLRLLANFAAWDGRTPS